MEGGAMIQYTFREAAEVDVQKIINLLNETIVEVYGQILPEDRLKPWAEGDQLTSDVNNSWQNMIVAEKAGEVVAVAARFDDLVGLVWVHPAHQREGIGSVLLDIVETEITKSGYGMAKLACFSDNDRAMRFYLNKGWKPLSEEMNEEAGALEMVMTKTLTKEDRC
ncbi:MAG TPA: GNAT family N-acetyltransferase [Methanothrix sp.]|nr:GNAT family N-acetyltransferase [Methanothrix sp.]